MGEGREKKRKGKETFFELGFILLSHVLLDATVDDKERFSPFIPPFFLAIFTRRHSVPDVLIISSSLAGIRAKFFSLAK